MAYSTSSPPMLIAQNIMGTRKLWFYASTDAAGTVDASGYITDGYNLGMRAGDFVLVLDSDASPLALTAHVVSSSSTTATDLSDGVNIGSTNSD